MEKKIFLFLALLIFSFHFCSSNILLYKNDLKEVKVNTKLIKKIYDKHVYDVKVSVGETFLGEITSISIEILNDNSSKYTNSLLSNKQKISERISNFISEIITTRTTGKIGPVSSVGNCVSTCNKTWNCYGQPTTAGVALCATDCLIECSGG